jgi:predicted permease
MVTLAAIPDSRPLRPESLMRSTRNSLRRSFRSLRRTPTVTLAALLCLALGLGATTAIFSAVNAALIRRLPFLHPERLVSVFRTTPHISHGPFSPATYLDLRAGTRSLEQLAAIAPNVGLLETPEGALRVNVYRASGNLFAMLGTAAVRGRVLRPEDERADQPPVVLVSEEIWRTRYGADPGLVGRTVRVNGEPRAVAGIVPRGFRIPEGSQTLRSDLWLPLRFDPDEAALRRNNFMFLLGRLRDGVTAEAADAELRSVMAGIIEAHPELRGESVLTLPLQRESVRTVRGPLLLLLGAVGLVLLIAAANVASLLLARGTERRREVAIRAAIGASRAGILREVLGESLVLAGGGALLGLGLAWAGVRGIGSLAAAQLPQLAGLSVDRRVMAFAMALAMLVALGCGIGPAWRASGADPQEALRAGGTRAARVDPLAAIRAE